MKKSVVVTLSIFLAASTLWAAKGKQKASYLEGTEEQGAAQNSNTSGKGRVEEENALKASLKKVKKSAWSGSLGVFLYTPEKAYMNSTTIYWYPKISYKLNKKQSLALRPEIISSVAKGSRMETYPDYLTFIFSDGRQFWKLGDMGFIQQFRYYLPTDERTLKRNVETPSGTLQVSSQTHQFRYYLMGSQKLSPKWNLDVTLNPRYYLRLGKREYLNGVDWLRLIGEGRVTYSPSEKLSFYSALGTYQLYKYPGLIYDKKSGAYKEAATNSSNMYFDLGTGFSIQKVHVDLYVEHFQDVNTQFALFSPDATYYNMYVSVPF
ncbi:MAG: hypothetical protein D6797_02230 [Bdellovibrio sp.]|nr:MAG: hypothetical protein D6797_02230 [Bdellovibrio sp.]